MRILVVDDEKIKRVTLTDDLAGQGYDVLAAADGAEALRLLDEERFDVVVTDLKMPGVDGIELLKHVKQGPAADIEVIMMTAYGSIPVAVEAVKLGAYDFITKPFRNEDLFPLLARIERARQGPEAAAPGRAEIEQTIVGRSPAVERVKRMVEICARTDSNVLLYGETGVGKDLVASVIHRASHRQGFPLVKVGCTLFPPQLIESELYGHEKGSFTGAEQKRPGRFDLAEGGTTAIKANVRIIASTKRNLLEKIGEGTFRQDLYCRLDVLRINIPPLRERREDVPALADHLLARIANDRPCEIEPEAVALLERHDWPGNIRELYHALERAYLVGSGRITAELLAADAGQAGEPAAALGMKPSTFRDRLAKHGLG